MDKTAEKLLIFKGSGRIEEYYGNMTSYLAEEKEAKEKQAAKIQKKPAQTGKKPKTQKEKTGLNYKERKEWETIEDEIMELEEKLEGVQAEMLEAGSDYGRLNELTKEQEQIEQRLDEKMERWEYLAHYADL